MTGSDVDERTSGPRTRGWALGWAWSCCSCSLFCVFGAVNDLTADASQRLPADHVGPFSALTETSFAHLKATTPAIANYLGVLERGYALHELTYALLFIGLLVIPFRRRQRWAWWATWLLMIANLGYTFTFVIHDSTILSPSLIADIALPVPLLAPSRCFFGTSRQEQ